MSGSTGSGKESAPCRTTRSKLLGGIDGRRFLTPAPAGNTVGDELKIATNGKSRVIGNLAQSSLGNPTGRSYADGAFWVERRQEHSQQLLLLCGSAGLG